MTREFLEYILRPVESWDTQTCVVDINFWAIPLLRGWCKMHRSPGCSGGGESALFL